MSRTTEELNMLRQIVLAAALAGTYGLTAGVARADDNPYHPTPAASTETADHGRLTYCNIQHVIPFYTCDQELAMAGEQKGFPAREGKHHVAPKPAKDPCDHEGGPPTGGDQASGAGDGNGGAGGTTRASMRS